MKIHFSNFYVKIISHKWLTLSVALLLFFAALYSLRGIRTEENIMKLLPDRQLEFKDFQQLLARFNSMTNMIIVLSAENGHEQDELMASADSLAAALQASGHFTRINYQWRLSDFLAALDILKQHRSSLFSTQDEEIISKRLEADSIRAYLEKWKQTLAESPAPFIAQQMLTDPLHFDDVLLKKLNSAQALGGSITIQDGRMFSKDLRHLIILAAPRYEAMDSDNSRRLIDFMDGLAQKIQGPNSSANLRLSYISSHRFSVENADRLKSDVQLTVSFSIIAIALLAFAVYSRPLLSLFTLLPAIFGTTLAMAAMRWMSDAVSVIIIGSGAMLIGISVDYGIHFLFYVDQAVSGQKQRPQIHGLVEALHQPFFISALTTVIAFAVLFFSNLPGYRQLGWFVSIGISASLLFVLFVIPLIVPNRKINNERKPLLPVTRFFPSFFRWSAKFRLLIIGLLILLTALLLPGLFRLEFEGDVQKLNSVSDDTRSDLELVQGLLGQSLNSTSLILKAPNPEAALQKVGQINKRLAQMQDDGLVVSFRSVSALLPSMPEQAKNRSRWSALFTDQRLAQLKSDFDALSQAQGFRPDAFAGFILALQKTSTNLTLADYQNTFLNEALDNQISIAAEETFVLSSINLKTAENFNVFKEKLLAEFPGTLIYNGQHAAQQMVRLIFDELKRIGLLSFLAIIIFLIIVYRSKWQTILLLLLPLLLCLLWTFGLLGWLGVKVTIFSSIVTVFVFGVVVDYGIFLISAFRDKMNGEESGVGCGANGSFEEYVERKARGEGQNGKVGAGNFAYDLSASKNAAQNTKFETQKKQDHVALSSGAITLSALTTMLGLGALVLARHPALYSLGITALTGIGFGLIAVLLVVPAAQNHRQIKRENADNKTKVIK